MDDVLTLGHTGRYRIDWIRRDDGSIRYRVTGFRLDGDPEEPPRVDARPTRGGGVRLTVRRDPTPGGTVTPECLRRTAAWLTDVAGELDRMRTLLELDLDRREPVGRARIRPRTRGRPRRGVRMRRHPPGRRPGWGKHRRTRPTDIEAICTLRITLEDLENALPNL